MSVSCLELRLATRGSRLAVVQAEEAARTVSRLLPFVRFTLFRCSTPGDRDKAADLRTRADDFFTRDLHESVLSGAADCAVHSAKDLEEHPPEGVDWFWLPDPADSRDVLVLRRGEALDGLRDGGIAGVSSDRREEYCRRHLPRLKIRSIRGTIEERLAQLDSGEYDVLVMAAAALQRLDLRDRIHAWIPLDELAPPEGQGQLAMTFLAGDERFLGLRSLFVKPVVFAGAGCGSVQTCTLGAWAALVRCDVCFHDSLLDPRLLDRLPPGARRVDVGKRCGAHPTEQSEINALLASAARRGRRVVRLKGGDPGIFGRLAEEIETLDALRLPYSVIPGVSSLNAATTGTGMLLTRRGVSRGFTVMTPRQGGGGVESVRAAARVELPMALFMASNALSDVVEQLRADSMAEATSVAVVFDAGGPNESIVRGDLSNIVNKLASSLPAILRPVASHPAPNTSHLAPSHPPPALVLIGAPAATAYHPEWGALMGRRVLLPGSEALAEKSADAVRDLGGIPVVLPLIRTVPEPACLPLLKTLRRFEWLVVTSPSAARILLRLLCEVGVDLRLLPKIAVAGPGTAEVLRSHGLVPDLIPERDFGAAGVLDAIRRSIAPSASILRVRSQAAGTELARVLEEAGHRVTDCILYRNEPIRPAGIPAFDAVFFASASSVEAFLSSQPANALAGKAVVAMGQPTLVALEKRGAHGTLTPPVASVEAAVETLAAAMVRKEMEKLS